MSAAKTNATVEKNKTKKPVDDVALPADDVIEDEKDESLEDEDLLEGIPEEELKAVESSAVAALPKVNSTRARARARRLPLILPLPCLRATRCVCTSRKSAKFRC